MTKSLLCWMLLLLPPMVAHARVMAKGDVCELQRAMMGKSLRGKKNLPKGSVVTVTDVGKRTVTVKLAEESIQVATHVLEQVCKLKPAVAPPMPTLAAVPPPAAPVEPAKPAATAPPPEAPAPAVAVSADTVQATGGTVVVTRFKASGVAEPEAEATSARIAEYLSNHSNYTVITMADLASMQDYHKDLTGMGCEDNACMAQLAKLANASLALSGSVGKVGEAFVINLSLIDVDASKSVAAGSATVPNLEKLDDALAPLCADIIGRGGAGNVARYHLPAGQKTSFAVFDLKAQGVSEDTARNSTQLLAVEMKKIEGTTVVSRDDINAMLQMQQQKDQLGCDSVACMAEIGGALGVDNLIAGDVGKVASRYIVTLRLMDVRNSRVLGRVNENFEGQEDQLLAAVRQAGRRLVGVEDGGTGSLAISTNQQQATIFVDGEAAGASPLPPIKTITNGKHAIRVSKDGYIDWRSDVFVESNNTTALWCALDEQPQKWYQKWWVWTIAGGAVALGTGAAIYFTQSAPTTGEGTVYLPQ